MSRTGSSLDLDRFSTSGKSRRSSSQAQVKVKPGDVLCDFCTARKQKAVKSCLFCLASYCESHLLSHYEYPALMKHKLVDTTGQMREKICAKHDKLLEVYCRTDETCVCVLCIMDEHKKHDIVAGATERTERQKQLGPTLLKSQERIEGRVKKWQDLRKAVDSLKHSAETVLVENDRIFTELLQSIERRHAEIREQVRAHEYSTVTQAEELLDRLEEEITLLRKKQTDLESLSHTDDHIHFIQSWQSLTGPSGYEDLSSVTIAPFYSFESAKKAISSLKVQLEDVSKAELRKISTAVKEVRILEPLEPRIREDFLQYSCDLMLDPNTTHPNLQLSEGNTRVTMVTTPKPYPEHLDRFDQLQQVLCKESLSGRRCYWEVDWSGTEIDIAVTYKGIGRKGKGKECGLGWNDQSWSLYCFESKYSFMHGNISTAIPGSSSPRIGVYLDHGAGTLAFYSVSDTMTLLHKVQTTFSEPLYPAFSVWGYGSTVKLAV